MTERELFFRYLGLPSHRPVGLEIDHAEGIYIYDKSGKRYLDLVSGISVSNLGHRHPAIISAIEDQIKKYLYLNVYGEFIQSPQVKLAQKLVSVLPDSLDSVFLVNSGSEAIEGAMKLAKRYTGRTEVVAFHKAYHGSTQGALSILGNETLKNAFRPLIPDIRFLEFNNFRDLEKISVKTACVVAETIQAEAGIILPEQGFLESLHARCQETGTLLIIDDVQMGFGRTGKLFSFEHFNFFPDILVLAKAMGGGMPVGAFIASKKIMDALAYHPEFGHITTFGGHPVCCAAALANLEVLLSGDLIFQAEKKGAILEEQVSSHPMIKNIRRKGLILGIEINDTGKRDKLTEILLKNGIIIDWFLFHPCTFRIAPPLTITEEECRCASDFVLKSLNEM
ncbi:MAG: aspartate aminotransferase family protein [Bacteroidales bacterium]|jgi:acetylornithine/succinyldiaminopimelate/putrescine aminotransferase